MREPGTTPVRQPLPPRAAMSKGSGRRPRFVPLHEYAANHERTFGNLAPQAEAQERFAAYHRGAADAPAGYVDLRTGQLENQLRFEAERNAPFGGKASVTVTDAHWDADGSLVVTGCRQVVTAPSPGSGDDAQA